MTIASYAKQLNERLTNLERGVEMAPERTYEEGKRAARAIDDASNGIIAAFREHGFKILNDDRLRNIEAMIYGYLLESNPEHSALITCEGFGEHVDGPAGERVLAQAKRDRDFLENMQKPEDEAPAPSP